MLSEHIPNMRGPKSLKLGKYVYVAAIYATSQLVWRFVTWDRHCWLCP